MLTGRRVVAGHDECLIRGDPKTRRFSLVYRKSGRVIALDCVNTPKDYVQGRALILTRALADSSLLRDPQVSLRELT